MNTSTPRSRGLRFATKGLLLSTTLVLGLTMSPMAASAANAKPSAPIGVTPTYVQGTTGVLVSWKLPVANTPAATFVALSAPGGLSCTTKGTSCTINNLLPGTTYTFKVTATNSYGSTVSNPSSAVTITLLPGAVTNLTTNYTPGSSSLTATWAAPLTGYPVPTSYTVILGSAGGPSVTVSNFSYTFTNLTPGVEYSISVKATNTVGTGPLTSTPPVIISQLPSAPQGVTANLVTGTSNALISWVAPAQGAPAPTNYTVTSSPGGLTCTTSTLSCTFTSLTLGTTYTFSVTATNVVGTGPAGVSNALSTAPPISPPGTPTFPNPKANARTVQLSWRASPNCGPGCQYKVLVNGAKFSSTTLTHLQVTGMVPDTSYRFTVIASSSKGTSSPSAPSRVARAWLTVLGPRATLSPGHFLFSPNRAYHLSILPNGRLAVLQGTRTHWIDPGGPGTKLLFSATGNIEFLNGAGLAWSSHTRFAAPRLEVGNSGYLNIYSGSRLVWRTNGGLVKAPVTTTTVYHHPVTTTTVHHRPPVTTTTVPGIPIP